MISETRASTTHMSRNRTQSEYRKKEREETPKIFRLMLLSIQDPAPVWATSTALGNYALTLGKGSEQGHDADNPTSASTDKSDEERYRVAASDKTTKIEIKK